MLLVSNSVSPTAISVFPNKQAGPAVELEIRS